MAKAGVKSTKTKKNLVIVESPAKAKTIKKYLGTKYEVTASMGHLRDLPKSQLGVDIEHDFEPKYITIRGKGDLIAKLKKDAKNSASVLLATDPDREGEAISWHLAALLGMDNAVPCRITFNEITKTAVKDAITKPRTINEDLVDAQQARRVLDRIVGYQISPLLWKKVKKGLSAGRVQSVATKLIVDREREIDAFCEEEYWTIDVKLTDDKGKKPFVAKFYGTSPKNKTDLPDETTATEISDSLKKASYRVETVNRGEKKRNPAPPFTTSTLQQEASRKLGFTARRTMAAAQQLYEGVDIKGSGSVGLITYMRTDSLRISAEAQSECRAYISEKYGEGYMPKTPKQYKTKKGAQDAHEAIRPTSMEFEPEKIKDSLKSDLYKLYRLIWNRFLASQMSNAVYDTVQADISGGGYILKASGSTVRFDGFTAVYVEGKDTEEEKEGKLPMIEEGQTLLFKDLEQKQAVLVRRDNHEKTVVSLDELETKVAEMLETIQKAMYEKAKAHRDAHTYEATDYEGFVKTINEKPGFVKAMWCGCQECEDKIKEDTGATSRCIPFAQEKLSDKCVCCGKPATKMVYWGRAY